MLFYYITVHNLVKYHSENFYKMRREEVWGIFTNDAIKYKFILFVALYFSVIELQWTTYNIIDTKYIKYVR